LTRLHGNTLVLAGALWLAWPALVRSQSPQGPVPLIPVPVNCTYSLSNTNFTIPSVPSMMSLGITTLPGCSYLSQSNSRAFIAISQPAPNDGPGTLQFSAAANNGSLPRTGSLTVAGQVVQILQRTLNPTAPYSDVPVDRPEADFITLLKQYRITNGCATTPAPLYCPDAPITRAQMAAFIIRSLFGGDTFTYNPTPYFTDVTSSSPFFPHIQKLAELGITVGCATSPALYCPDVPITRTQAAVMLIRAKFGNNFTFNASPTFTDVLPSDPSLPYIQKLRDLGVTNGCTATMYCGGSSLTRAQAAVFIVRSLFTPY
jgi:hypothetical protein